MWPLVHQHCEPISGSAITSVTPTKIIVNITNPASTTFGLTTVFYGFNNSVGYTIAGSMRSCFGTPTPTPREVF